MDARLLVARLAGLTAAVLLVSRPVGAQELQPAAYTVTPVGVNVVTLSASVNGGDLAFDPSGPIDEASARIATMALNYARALDVAGRSGNVAVYVPLVIGDLEGLYLGEFREVTRNGLGDPRVRFSVNLYGGPAMDLATFARSDRPTIVGASVTVVPPLGQYSPARLIDIGTNRWSFKPEVGVSRRWGRWTLELYAGVWLFTDNTEFYGGTVREQDPIGSGQVHLEYRFPSGVWLSANGNFYTGGRTRIDGRLNLDLQRNSRVGLTGNVPLSRRHALRLAYSRGAYTTIGADFTSVAVAFQTVWGGGL